MKNMDMNPISQESVINQFNNNKDNKDNKDIQTYSKIDSLTFQAFGDFKFESTNNPLIELENCTSIIIKQIPEYFELVTGFERNISYNIFGVSPQGYKYLFKCIEDTGCLNRWLCPLRFRKLDMNYFHNSSFPIQPENSKFFANFTKPYKCPCFCLSRPEIIVKLNENNEIIGKIKKPFSTCEEIYEIYDEKEKIKYNIKGKSCQCGLLCANSIMGKMGEAYFNIIDPESKEQIGTIIKKSPVTSNSDFSENENYKVTFPEKASVNEKLLLLSLGLMIDYEYFELDPSVI